MGNGFLGDLATVAVHIRRIREKIEVDPANPVYIETVWGAGYRFKKNIVNWRCLLWVIVAPVSDIFFTKWLQVKLLCVNIVSK